MGFNLQLGDALRSESVTAIDDAIREIVRQEIARTPRSKFCESCAYMHQPEISARCCCVACHGDDVPAWAQRMSTPPSIEKTGESASSGSASGRTTVLNADSPASPVKPCPFCASTKLRAKDDAEQGYKWGAIECEECSARGPEVRTGYDKPEKWRPAAIEEWNRRTSAPSPASGESARTASKDASKELDELLAVFAKGDDDDEDCWTQPARRAQLYVASLRAEVERLRTALAEKEKAGVNANAVVERCIELVVRKKTPSWDEVSVWCDALRTAIGAKEIKENNNGKG